jgi:DNA-binding response OmpR family regulator
MTSSSETPLTVAIVDDDPAILAALSRALKMENYKVELHRSAQLAVRGCPRQALTLQKITAAQSSELPERR